jgi:hypothetical protein
MDIESNVYELEVKNVVEIISNIVEVTILNVPGYKLTLSIVDPVTGEDLAGKKRKEGDNIKWIATAEAEGNPLSGKLITLYALDEAGNPQKVDEGYTDVNGKVERTVAIPYWIIPGLDPEKERVVKWYASYTI